MIRIILFLTITCLIPLKAVAQHIELRFKADSFHADWFEADEPNGHALIFLGGAEGGNDAGNLMAPYFQSEGYHVLSLAYFRAEGLHGQLENIPVEVVAKAVMWIKSNHGNRVKKIGLIGGSKGAELALISATHFQNIDALVLISPSSVVWQSINEQDWTSKESSWTLEGQPLPYLSYDFSRGTEKMYDFYRAAIDNLTDSKAIINAENSDSPILILSGEQDNIWPSKIMAGMIISRLEENNFAHPFFHYSFEDAGHLLIHPAVFDESIAWPEKSTFEFTGGSFENFDSIANSALQKIIDFLKDNL